ncbi:sigma-54-dependent Fis family transcriptional regulator [Desulfitobacterium sp.]|uniref:sigma-54-dependent Fis family transcriptional regulator n=1 Tax=Desulfitobacterium sp. TaxID=49981 RepID=UPI002B9DE5FB|nr:sigma 54-interacting transcriptional regulator [Desulfitobacterium sp.]HVJ48016.1 sigma 54-interacting transcriptional regulator [Desulfitobacterium sp.]
MKDGIFETFPFGIICLSPDNQILRKNKKACQFLQHLDSQELYPLLKKFKEEQITSWAGFNNENLYINHFEIENTPGSLILMGTDLDFTNNVPSIFEQSIEDFTANPHEVIDRIVALIGDAVIFERFDLLRVDPQIRKYTYEYSIGINIEGTVHTAYSEMKNSGLVWIFEHETPHLVQDLGQIDTSFFEDPLLFQAGFRSLLRIPIVFDHGVVGAIMLASSEVGRFQLEDAFLLEQLAKLFAQAYFHSGLQLEYEYKELTTCTFIQTAIALVNETNVKEFLGEYCEKLRNTSKMDQVSIFLLDDKKKQRLCLAQAGREALDSGDWIPIPDTGMLEMLQNQSIVSFNLTNPLYSNVAHLIGKGFTSAIYSPISKNGQIVGALGAICSDESALSSFTAGLFKIASEQMSLIFAKVPLKPSPAKYRKPCQAIHLGFQNIIGTSQIMQETIHRAATASQYEFPILVTGETGTGKELFAKAIHQTSKVADGPFIVVNSAAIPENLLESELFGYQEGAFTGGLKGGKRGKILLADKGTLFLDEIGELSPELQAKLLRVIQEQEVEPLGSTKPIPVQVRIISATHRDLNQMVQEGGFREDLLYRLNAIEIQLPPLRERGNDIIELAEHMLEQLSQSHGVDPKTFSPGTRELLLEYNWPGNVRQLQNIINQLFVFVESATIQPKDLPPDFHSAPESSAETEKDKMVRLLDEFGGNKTALAHYLGITRTGLWKKLKRLGLQQSMI